MIKVIDNILKERKNANLSSETAREDIAKEIENRLKDNFIIIEKKENLSLGSDVN